MNGRIVELCCGEPPRIINLCGRRTGADTPTDIFSGLSRDQLLTECRVLKQKCDELAGQRLELMSEASQLREDLHVSRTQAVNYRTAIRQFLADHIETGDGETVKVGKHVVAAFRDVMMQKGV